MKYPTFDGQDHDQLVEQLLHIHDSAEAELQKQKKAETTYNCMRRDLSSWLLQAPPAARHAYEGELIRRELSKAMDPETEQALRGLGQTKAEQA